jgi:hypothetical protein
MVQRVAEPRCDFVFAATHDYLLSNGYAWVGVSAQLTGTNALKQANPARYSNLNLDASNEDPAGEKLDAQGDVLSWDIFAHVGAALRNRGPQFLRNGILRAPDGTALSPTDVVAECDTQPIWSRVPNGHVVAAAIHAMQLWLKDGVPAPTAPRLATDDSGQLLRDPQGGFSAASGWRHSTSRLPTIGAANTGSGSCSQAGYHIDFTPVELRERYGSQHNYIDQVTRITRKAKRDGFLVSADADRTIEEAKTVKF